MLRLLALAAVIGALAVVIINYGQLPERIPSHFGPGGEPDSYGNKLFVWFIPILNVGLYVLLGAIHKAPKSMLNYPVKVTEENEARQYNNMIELNKLLRAFLCLGLAYISWSIVYTALGQQTGLGNWFFWVFLLGIFGIVGYYFWRALQLK